MTRNLSVALAISAILTNSSLNSSSRLSRPAVSIIRTSAVPTALIPFRTIFAASFSSGSP